MTEHIHVSAESSRAAGIAYHLIPVPVWEVQRRQDRYKPEAYENDGFIHLTLGLDPLLKVANMFYTGDSRDFRVLILSIAKIDTEIRFEDPDEIYPHVYGLLNTNAVIGELDTVRTSDGRFVEIVTGSVDS